MLNTIVGTIFVYNEGVRCNDDIVLSKLVKRL